MKDGKHFRFFLPLLLIILIILVLVVLFSWTDSISEKNRLKELSKELEKVTKEGGEAALLSLAGIKLSNIFYGDDGVIIFADSSDSWNYSADELQNMSVYENSKKSVVEVISLSGLYDRSSGCGVIISSDGYCITNGHVIGSGDSFTCLMEDGSAISASLVGVDKMTDIAVIKLEKREEKYIPLSFALDKELKVGQKVIAIGSPFGWSWSQSVGTISGLGRLVTSSSGIPLANMIQTDAAVNPGNSGGPLLDGHGRIVGLNTAIYTTTGTAQGISFAIPIDTVMTVATDLIRKGRVSRGWLDILSVEMNPIIAEYMNIPVETRGILISQVVPSGEADRGGLRGGNNRVQYGNSEIYLGGDIITKIGSSVIENTNDYYTALLSTKAGDKMDIEVIRNGQKTRIKGVVLVEQTEENTRWVIR
ncbi:MAG: trypsin-like peptidase domain-containing protein [Sphaerochaetaceae bacterium]|nr:trypsin-like peptidase domain-containing protein [Sphaerochaetaceae bacterium]